MMDLSTDVTSAVTDGRALAESLMLDTCLITRASDATGIDPDTGLPPDNPDITIYAGRCKVQSDSVQAVNPTTGEHTYTVDRLSLHVPVSATGIAVGDLATITASQTDPAQVGRKLQITGKFRKTFATAQRLPVEEVLA